ncbi:MAG: hypothetical protein HYU36_15460 [Planctomycetes bacterium]|nr:hypothetical protein [Planctomycetota bacterium]
MSKSPFRRPALSILLVHLAAMNAHPEGSRADPAMLPHAFIVDTPVERGGMAILTADDREARKQGKSISKMIEKVSGVTVEVIPSGKACRSGTPFLNPALLQKHLVLVGNLNTNRAFLQFYALGYAPIDRVWPGGDKIYLRTVSSAVEPGWNLLVVGGSTAESIQEAVEEFLHRLKTAPATPGSPFRIPPLPESYARPGTPEAAALKKGLQGINPRQYDTPSFRGFMGSHYGLPLFMDAWSQSVRSGAWTPEELAREENALLECAIANEGGYWRRAHGWRIFSTHDVVGSLGYLQMVEYLLRFASPNDQAKSILWRLHFETRSYFERLCRVSQTEEETTEAVSNMHRAFLYAMRTGDAGFFSGGTAHATALKALAYTDPLGGSIGTGTYGDASGGGLKKNAGGSFIWSACALYFREGRYRWLLGQIGLPADQAGYGLYQALSIKPDGPGSYPADEGVEPVRPDEWLAFAAPMDAFYYEKAQQSRRWAHLPIPLESAFTKAVLRDGWDRDSAFLALMGEHAGWVPGLDANSIIRYTDRGRIWLLHNTSRVSHLYRNGVYVSPGGQPEPFPWGCRLKSLSAFSGGSFLASELPGYNGTDWTRHLFRRHGEFAVVLDVLTLKNERPYVLSCNWRTLHPAARLEGGAFSCTDGGFQFILRPSEDLRQQVILPGKVPSLIQEGEGIPGILLRQSKTLRGGSDRLAVFQNLFHVNGPGEDRSLRLRRLSATGVAIEGKTPAGPLKAILAVRPPGLTSGPKSLYRAGEFESDAACLYLATDLAVAVDATTVRCRGRELARSRAPKTLLLDPIPDLIIPEPETDPREAPASPVVSPGVADLPLRTLARFDGLDRSGPRIQPDAVQSAAGPDGSLQLTLDLGQSTRLMRLVLIDWPDPKKVQLALSETDSPGDFRPVDAPFEAFTAFEPSTKASVRLAPSCRMALAASARCIQLSFSPLAQGKPAVFAPASVRAIADEPRRAVLSHLMPVAILGREDGVVAATEEGHLVALAPDASPLWSHQLGARFTHLRPMDLEERGRPDTLLVATGDGKLRAIALDGTMIWERVVHSPDSPAGFTGPFRTPYGVQGPVFSTALWRPGPGQPPWLACGQYAGVNYLNLQGEILGNAWVYGAYQMAATPFGQDLDGDGCDELAFVHNWGGLSIIQGKLQHVRDARRGPAYGVQGGAGSIECPRGRPLFMEQWTPPGAEKPMAFVVTEEGVGAYDLAKEKPLWEFPFFGPNVLAGAADLGSGQKELWVARLDGFLVRMAPDGRTLGSFYVADEITGVAPLARQGHLQAILVAARSGLFFFDPAGQLQAFRAGPIQAAVALRRVNDSAAAVASESGEISFLGW